MKTSYWSNKSVPDHLRVRISIGKPDNFNGKEEPLLMPTWDMVKSGYYSKHQYKELLTNRGINYQEIYEKYKDNVLCCYEKDRINCHRGYLAEIFKEELNIIVEEW